LERRDSGAVPAQIRVAFINTRMPGLTFLARDLIALVRAGVVVDLYVFEDSSLDPDVVRTLISGGGRVEKISFPWSREISAAILAELGRHPGRLAWSVALGLWTLLCSPQEGIRTLGVLPAALALSRRLADTGVDQVHGMWAGVPASVALWLRRHGGYPFSFSGHAWDVAARTRLLARKLALSRGMVVCSGHARSLVDRAIPEGLRDRVTIVHHGMDLDAWPYTPRRHSEGAPVILGVGKLIELKGYRFLIQACDRLRSRGLEFRCEIVGPEGEEGPALRELVGRLGLNERVVFAGEVTAAEVRTRMQAASVLAAPSIQQPSGRADGIPNVLLEAMALGTPIVAADAGGLGEVILHRRTGLLVAQRDPDALADALAEVLEDRDAALRRAEAARRVLERGFAAPVVAREFLRAVGLAPED